MFFPMLYFTLSKLFKSYIAKTDFKKKKSKTDCVFLRFFSFNLQNCKLNFKFKLASLSPNFEPELASLVIQWARLNPSR